MTALAALYGSLAGLGGITHGVGEIVQGSSRPGGIVFESWTRGPIADNLGGEPAMSLIPNLRTTGVVTVAAALVLIAWSLSSASSDHRHAGAGFVLLSATLLLVGGGFGPPILGMLAGLIAAAAHASRPDVARRLAGTRAVLAGWWPGLFWLCAVNAAFMVVGSLIVGGLLGMAAPDLFVASLFLAVLATPVAALAGTAAQTSQSFVAPGTPTRQLR